MAPPTSNQLPELRKKRNQSRLKGFRPHLRGRLLNQQHPNRSHIHRLPSVPSQKRRVKEKRLPVATHKVSWTGPLTRYLFQLQALQEALDLYVISVFT